MIPTQGQNNAARQDVLKVIDCMNWEDYPFTENQLEDLCWSGIGNIISASYQSQSWRIKFEGFWNKLSQETKELAWANMKNVLSQAGISNPKQRTFKGPVLALSKKTGKIGALSGGGLLANIKNDEYIIIQGLTSHAVNAITKMTGSPIANRIANKTETQATAANKFLKGE
jgi:hypothetical protein